MAVVDEIADIRLYEHEAMLFRRKVIGGDRIGAMFERFAEEERAHHEALRGMASIDDLGKVSPGAPPRSDSLRETLRTHVERELRSIRTCEELLRKLTDAKQRLLVKGIMADEKDHLQAALKYLKRLRPF